MAAISKLVGSSIQVINKLVRVINKLVRVFNKLKVVVQLFRHIMAIVEQFVLVNIRPPIFHKEHTLF